MPRRLRRLRRGKDHSRTAAHAPTLFPIDASEDGDNDDALDRWKNATRWVAEWSFLRTAAQTNSGNLKCRKCRDSQSHDPISSETVKGGMETLVKFAPDSKQFIFFPGEKPLFLKGKGRERDAVGHQKKGNERKIHHLDADCGAVEPSPPSRSCNLAPPPAGHRSGGAATLRRCGKCSMKTDLSIHSHRMN